MTDEVKEIYIQSGILHEQGKSDAALKYIDKAIELDNMDSALYLRKGIILTGLGRYSEAMSEIQKALKTNRKCAEAYYHIGSIYALTENYEKAVENYNKALSMGYSDSKVFYHLGMLYDEMKDYEMSLRYYTQVCLNVPNDLNAKIKRIKALIQTGHYEDAVNASDNLLLFDSAAFEGYHYKMTAYAKMGKTKEAMEVIEGALRLFPKDIGFMVDKSRLLIDLGRFDESMANVDAILSMEDIPQPQKRTLYITKAGLIAEKDETSEEAIKALEKAREISKQINPDEYDAYISFIQSTLHMRRKEYEEVIRLCDEMIEEEPNEYTLAAYYYKPRAVSELQGVEAALPIYKKSISRLRNISLVDSDAIDSYFYRLLCLKDIGEYDKAMELCDYLINLYPDNNSFIMAQKSIREAQAAAGK